VSERATFDGGVGSLADSEGRSISRFLKSDITVSRYEQWAQGVVERLADKEVPSVGCRVSAATDVIAKFTRSPNWQLLSTKICPDHR
jgi:hypothetical protein